MSVGAAHCTRTYRQTRRADATERTRARILDAAQALFRADPQLDPSLDAVAARAGVSTRTVIRQFGSKDGLLEAAITAGIEASAATRHAEPGDVAGAVAAVVAHYEEMGDEVMRWLALAERLPVVRRVTERGAESHLAWVEAIFAPDLGGLPRGARRARRAALAAATDVYVWHLLRRREGLGRAAVEAAILAFVEATRRAAAAGSTPSAPRGRPAGSTQSAQADASLDSTPSAGGGRPAGSRPSVHAGASPDPTRPARGGGAQADPARSAHADARSVRAAGSAR